MSTFVIAEIGVNHNGDMDMAKKLIANAASAGCNAVKFQTFTASELVTPAADKAVYQRINDGRGTQLDMLKRLELSINQHYDLKAYCESNHIEFLSTGFGISQLEFLVDLGIKRVKIPSGELTNLPFLRAAARTGLPIILSTGMSDLSEIQASLQALEDSGCKRQSITSLHCTSLYPAPFETVNLLALAQIQQECSVAVGYSDHTLGSQVAIAAVALGAKIIEKHFTLDRNLPGPDHRASLEPKELLSFVQAIRSVEVAMGDGIKQPCKEELETRIAARRSIVAARYIETGEILTPINMTCKRPGHGISPMHWDQLLGRRASRSYRIDDLIEELPQ